MRGVMRQTDLAWAAGLFDGEGCVSLRPRQRANQRTRGYELRVEASMTDQATIQRLQSLFGGTCRFDEARQRRCPDWQPQWSWVLGTGQSVAFLQRVRPYSTTKATQIWLALEWAAARKSPIRKGVPRGEFLISDEEQALQDGFAAALSQAKKGGQ